MERLLKSVISTKSLSDQSFLKENINFLVSSKLEFLGVDDELFTFIYNYYDKFQEVPVIRSIRDTFEKESKLEILARLDTVEQATPYFKTGFQKLVADFYSDQQEKAFGTLLKQSAAIANTGLRFGKHDLKKGIRDAARHFLENSDRFLTTGVGKKLEGAIREDGDEVLEEYHIRKADPRQGVGQLTGIERIDQNFRGARKGELMLIAGAFGEYKTTLALNYAYNQAVLYGWNNVFFSLEMQYEHIRRLLYAIHSAHLKFRDLHEPLNYEKLRDGLLNTEEEDFLTVVVDDFKNNKNYGTIYVVQPEDDITISDIKAKSEYLNQKFGLQSIFIDYLGLVEPERRYGDFALDLNWVLKRAKRLANTFNSGEGIPIISPFQTNRKGRADAEKNDLVYKHDCLSYANEAERSSDIVIWGIVDMPMRKNGEIKLGCLKARDHHIFEPFLVRICKETRKISNLIEVTSGEIEESTLDE